MSSKYIYSVVHGIQVNEILVMSFGSVFWTRLDQSQDIIITHFYSSDWVKQFEFFDYVVKLLTQLGCWICGHFSVRFVAQTFPDFQKEKVKWKHKVPKEYWVSFLLFELTISNRIKLYLCRGSIRQSGRERRFWSRNDSKRLGDTQFSTTNSLGSDSSRYFKFSRFILVCIDWVLNF